MAYVYSHTRLDTNEVFYIGIGSDKNKYRAKSKKGRNKYWLNIVNKTDYTISILYDNLTWEEVQLKEIELIDKYGRFDKTKGKLVNLTNGGEGRLGSQDVNTPLYQIDLNGIIIKEWKNVFSIIKENPNYKKGVLYNCLNHKKNNITHNGFIWIYKEEYSNSIIQEKLEYLEKRYKRSIKTRGDYQHSEESRKLMSLKNKESYKNNTRKKRENFTIKSKYKVRLICQITNNILNFDSVLECCDFLKCVTSTISKNKNKIYKNYKIECYGKKD